MSSKEEGNVGEVRKKGRDPQRSRRYEGIQAEGRGIGEYFKHGEPEEEGVIGRR